jgi:spore germination protein YaaH
MIRRNQGWSAQPGGVLYPQRSPGGWVRPALLGIILLATVAVAAFIGFRLCSGSDCEGDYCATGASIATPEGYERLSDIYEWRGDDTATAAADIQISVPLNEQTSDGRNLSFFRYDEATRSWEPFAAAILDPAGRSVSGRLNTAPPVIAVMRRLSAAGHVVAYVPHNRPLNRDAAQIATIVHPRDFTVVSDGALAGDVSDPRALGLPEGSSAQVYPVVSVDASNPQARAVISGLLASSQTRTAHVQQIVQRVVSANLGGIDIDYANLPATERTPFALFISELAEALHEQQKVLTVTLPPPVRLPDRVDEGAYDWAEIGRAADVIKIGVYRDQNTFRRNMPDILAYLATKISPGKLVLTVTPYAAEKGPDDTLQAMTLINALKIAAALTLNVGAEGRITTNTNVEVVATNIDRTQGRTGIKWDPQVAAVAFTYELSGGRTVWIENTFSVGFKLELIPRFGLGGLAVEDASADETIGNIWPAIVPFVASGQPVLLQPNPTDLIPRWTVSDGQAEGGERGTISWLTPPRPGTYAITLSISDGVVVLENVIEVNVTEAPSASPTPASGG